MSVLWHKVWFDLWHQKGRTLLAILSVAAGVFAVGMILGLVDQLLSGMDEAHQAVRPSHVSVILRNYIPEELADRLRDIDGVVDVEPVNQISVRYKARPGDEWELGTLVMRPDYEEQTYDLMVLREGEWPSYPQIGIERLSSQYYGMDVGDQVILDLDGEERSFEINGKIRHPFVEPPLFGGQAHFFTDAAGLAEFGVPEGLYGQLLVRVEPYSEERALEVAAEIRSQLGQQGIGVVVTLYQDPERHWGRMFVEGVTLVLQVMAGVSLFLSVILVLNTTNALITQQTDQIGVIKAVGGRSTTVLRVYLAQVLIYGLGALVISLPLAALTAYATSRWFLNLFNVEVEAFQFSDRAIVAQLLAAILAPLLAALWPVLKGAAITVREAIATYGLGSDFGTSWVDRAAERIGTRLLPSPYGVSLGNMFRRKGRLALTLLVLVTAGVMTLVVMSLISSTQLTLDNEMARRLYDVRIGFTRSQPAAEVLSVVGSVEGTEDAQVWYSRNATLLRQGERLQDSAGLGAQLTGIPVGTEMYRPIVPDGRWLQPDDVRAIVISQETADKNGIAVSDEVTLDLGDRGEGTWRVVGTYRVVYGGGFVTEAIYAPLEAVLDAAGEPDSGTQVLVQTGPSTLDGVTAIADELKTAFQNEGMAIDFYTTTVKLEERGYVDNQFGTVVSMLLGLAMLVATVGGIGLMGSLAISVLERRREIGVMRAVGARSRTIMALFVMEGVLQGVISWLVALPLSFILAQPLARALGQTMIEVDLDYAFNWPFVLVWLGTVLFLAVLASILPARDATRTSVRESLAYG
ncbi:MAG: FtsX-like permease family protein [Anaerolineae bacterium]|jgi:putative ABC transport system permease protein